MGWRNLPNAITLGRIVLAVLVAPLVMYDGSTVRAVAFVVFLAAAFSDLWDGHLARSRNLITDFGKLMDPLADKLLLVATFVPFYLLSHGWEPASTFPLAKTPFAIATAIIFGRELFVTGFRGFAAKRGVVLAAGPAGKLKAVFQNIFSGAAIVWYALQSASREHHWAGMHFWEKIWIPFHSWFTVVTLLVAVTLTVYSLYVYLNTFRRVNLSGRATP
jgi:CDP-diacylglycerol---glycerol-3-phosphate 3-phosphatidyltransferase